MAKTTTVNKSKSKALPPDTSDLRNYYVDVQNPRNLNNIYMTEFSGLSPDNLHYYFDASRRGLNFWKSLLFEEIRRRDLRIGAVCQTRKLAVAKKKWELSYSTDSAVPEATQKEHKDFLYSNYRNINFVQFITDIVEAQIQGVSTFEIIYKTDGSKYYLDQICYNPNYILLFNDLANEYRYLNHEKADAFGLRSISWNTTQDRIDISGLQIDPINPLKLIEVESLDGNAQNGFLNGCIDSLIWAFLFKNYGLKDWAIYIERFASPAVVGKYPALMNKQNKTQLFDAVKNWGNLFKATIPMECSIDLLSDAGKSSTQTLFKDYVNYWDKNISIRVLGQSLTTDIGDVGSRAAAQTHDQVREDLVIADMILVSHVINGLNKRLIDINYPGIKEYPVFEFEEELNIDFKLKRSEIIRNLKQSGWTTSQEDIQEEFDIEVEANPVNTPPPEPALQDTPKYISKFIEDYWNGIQR